MTQLYVSIAVGTAATMLAALLLMLRAKIQGRRLVVALTLRWIAASTQTSGLALSLLCAIAVFCFARIPVHELRASSSAPALDLLSNAPAAQGTGLDPDESSSDAQALESLRAYADTLDTKPQPAAATPRDPNSTELPAVDMMIAKLAARLEKQPDDVTGWKTLAWSYLNTDRPVEAVRAYETALKLEPGDFEIKKGLEDAKSAQALAQTGTTQAPPSDPAASPTAQDIKAAEGLSETQANSMIRGMVGQLAARLETSPNDEDGWMRLMRSRMTLGEKDAAKAALTKALETFASDAAVKARLTSTARELGVDIN